MSIKLVRAKFWKIYLKIEKIFTYKLLFSRLLIGTNLYLICSVQISLKPTALTYVHAYILRWPINLYVTARGLSDLELTSNNKKTIWKKRFGKSMTQPRLISAIITWKLVSSQQYLVPRLLEIDKTVLEIRDVVILVSKRSFHVQLFLNSCCNSRATLSADLNVESDSSTVLCYITTLKLLFV